NPVKEAKKRAEEEKTRVKEEEEKRLRELKEAEDKAKEEERRLKEEEEKRLREESNKLKEEEKRLKEEEERRVREEEGKLREEKRLKEEEEKRVREEENKRRDEEKRLREEEEKRIREEEKRLKEEERNRLKADKIRPKEEKEEERRNEGAKIAKGAAGAPTRTDGLDVAILMKNSRGVFAPVDPSREFVNGEQFRVEYDSRLDGVVYFVNVDPKGVATVIYRDEVSYGKKYVHPAPEEDKVIQFRGSSGVEVLKIIISPKEILELENALRESGGKMGTNTQQAKDELQGYVAPAQATGKSCSGLELSSGGAKVDCRELRVVSMAQDQGKISVAVNPKNGGTRPASRDSARLSDGEVAVLEIRLKHVQ
ncbi:MAG TPA: hypothetical protein VFS27_05945, partial [Blastocatellia bacterium]|nr:hypothetical protein [Blastocatellia bacterium]